MLGFVDSIGKRLFLPWKNQGNNLTPTKATFDVSKGYSFPKVLFWKFLEQIIKWSNVFTRRERIRATEDGRSGGKDLKYIKAMKITKAHRSLSWTQLSREERVGRRKSLMMLRNGWLCTMVLCFSFCFLFFLFFLFLCIFLFFFVFFCFLFPHLFS